MLAYLAMLLGSLVVPLAPTELAYRIGAAVADLVYFLARGRRRAVLCNLRHVLPQETPDRIDQVGREVFRHGAWNYVDLLLAPRVSTDKLLRLAEVRGWEHLDAALGHGCGVIMFSAHVGSISLVDHLVAARGHAVTVIVEPLRPPALLRLLNRMRQSHGLSMVAAAPAVTGSLLQVLRNNGIIGMVADRDVTGTGLKAPFFDAPTIMPSAPAILALRTGALLVPAFTVRVPGGRYLGFIEEPIELVRTGDLRHDILRGVRSITQVIERYVNSYPEQWTVFQKVWTGPEDRESLSAFGDRPR